MPSAHAKVHGSSGRNLLDLLCTCRTEYAHDVVCGVTVVPVNDRLSNRYDERIVNWRTCDAVVFVGIAQGGGWSP